MRPDLLALIPEFADAWAACEAAGLPWAAMGAPFDGEIRRCSDFAHLFTDVDDHPEARHFVGVASYELPLALEAIAEARRERDEVLTALAEARSSVLRLASREEDLEADVENAEMDAAAARRERDEARARLAKLGKAALTLLSVLDVHEDATEGRELADGVYADTYHPDHADAVYEAKSALRAASVHTPGEDPAPHGAGAPDASGGASGVGVLTNCDSCRHDYVTTTGVHEVHGCRRLDNDDADFDAVSEWSFANCNTRRDARPDPGATGCPGWAKRGEG